MDVKTALGNSSKGQLKYDRFWHVEGRTKEILDNVTKISINIDSRVLPLILNECVDEEQNDVKNPEVIATKPKLISDKSNDVDTYFYELQSEMELPIMEYEEERWKYIQEVFEMKKMEFENHELSLEQQTEQQYELTRRNNELDAKRKAADLKRIQDAILQEEREKELLQKQHIQSQAKKLSAIVQEAEMKQQRAEEELKRREQEQQEFRLQLNKCKSEIEILLNKAQEKLKSCDHANYLRISIDDRKAQIASFLLQIQNIANDAQSRPLLIEDILNVNSILKKIYEFCQDVTNDVDLTKVKALQDNEKYLSKIESTKNIANIDAFSSGNVVMSSAAEVLDVPLKSTTKTGAEKSSKSKISDEVKAVLSEFIAPDVVEEYHKIMETLKNVEEKVKVKTKGFSDDPLDKKMRFELLKSINIPINAISSSSGSHVRDKIGRLLTILHSRDANNPLVFSFCANLIAKKFVEQGDKQVSAQHSTAFPIALAIVGVWIKKPDVGPLILAHFYRNCPYLVPYYPPRKEDQSDQDFYESLGYQFDKEGNVEVKYKFLNRMSGFMRLYAAIIVSQVPPGSTSYQHPHGVACGWRWLSRILNMNPRPDITATVLFDFLDVTGHMLQKIYGKQFKKILHIICKDFFPKIKRVTPSGSGGPVERLETFLQQAVRKGYIPVPEGVLDSSFWHT